MIIKLWGEYIPLTNIFNIDFRFKKDFPDNFKSKIIFDTKLELPIRDSWVLIDYDTITYEVKILETRNITSFVDSDEITNIIKENKNNEILKITTVKTKYKMPDDLVLNEDTWSLLNATLDMKMYPLLLGAKGTGKTKTAMSIANARGMNFFPINCGSLFKPKQTLVGQLQVKDGATYFAEAEFLKHFTNDGDKPTLIFLNEISRIPPSAANYLMGVLDRMQGYIYIEEEGRRVYKGKNVFFIADANFGFEYSDTRNLDGAFMDRFIKFIIEVLPMDKEIQLIKKRVPDADEGDIAELVKSAIRFRKQEEKLRTSISTRQLIDMAQFLAAGFPLLMIWENVFKNLFLNGSTDEREAAQQIMDAHR